MYLARIGFAGIQCHAPLYATLTILQAPANVHVHSVDGPALHGSVGCPKPEGIVGVASNNGEGRIVPILVESLNGEVNLVCIMRPAQT